MSLSLHTPKLNIFIKMLNSYQIITSFGSHKILTPSFSYYITNKKKRGKSIATYDFHIIHKATS